MTKVLMSLENPTGFKLEELALTLVEDIHLKTAKLNPTASVSEAVAKINNEAIIEHLKHINRLQTITMQSFEKEFGPDKGPTDSRLENKGRMLVVPTLGVSGVLSGSEIGLPKCTQYGVSVQPHILKYGSMVDLIKATQLTEVSPAAVTINDMDYVEVVGMGRHFFRLSDDTATPVFYVDLSTEFGDDGEALAEHVITVDGNLPATDGSTLKDHPALFLGSRVNLSEGDVINYKLTFNGGFDKGLSKLVVVSDEIKIMSSKDKAIETFEDDVEFYCIPKYHIVGYIPVMYRYNPNKR